MEIFLMSDLFLPVFMCDVCFYTRLKLLNDQEKAYQEHKEEENKKKITNLKDELTKLKSFALLVIDEQQGLMVQFAQQTAMVQQLQAAARHTQEELNSVQSRSQQMESKVLHLETELLDQAVQFQQKQEAMRTELTDEKNHNRHLHQKLSTLSQELDELKELNKVFHRAEEELQELRDKNSNGEKGNSCLMSEVEELRKRVVEMEGNDEELIKMENLCKDLSRKLERESTQNYSLEEEVKKLNHRIMELEKLEDVFEKCKTECSLFKCNLEKERTVTKHICNELDNLRVRIKELEAAERLLEKTEWTLKEDIKKLKTLTVMLYDERKTMAENVQQQENKAQISADKLQEEQNKVTLVTEKLIEESKNALKIKVEMEERIRIYTTESDDLKSKLKAEEEKNHALQNKVSMIKKRLQSLETVEREFLQSKAKQENIKNINHNNGQQNVNNVNSLTQEVEWPREMLREMKLVEDDLPKTHNEDKSLEKSCSNEKALMEKLLFAKKELSKYQLMEKKNLNQEHIVYKLLKEEEVKSSHLTKEVEALKETIHNYMHTEESVCCMKAEYATLQRKLNQQEVRNKELMREKDSLTKELERYHRFSKSLRPGMIGRRFSDLHVSTKEVQTESTVTPTYTNLCVLEQAVVNGQMYEESNGQYEPKYNEIKLAKCNLSLQNSNNHQNNTKHIRDPLLKSLEKHPFVACKMETQNEAYNQQGKVLIPHNPRPLLQINSNNTATPEIASPTTDNTLSYNTTAVIPTSVCTTKQEFPTFQNATLSPQNKKSHPSINSPSTPDQSMLPLSKTAYSSPVIPEFTSLAPDNAMTSTETTTIFTEVSNKAQTTEVKAGHIIFCVTPERQKYWHVHRYNSPSPSVTTSEDNKISIHLGIPCLQTIKSNTEASKPCYSTGHEQDNSKIASGIGIKSISQPSQITVSS